jgi:copper(I)-binding protein
MNYHQYQEETVRKRSLLFIGIFVIVGFALSACQGTAPNITDAWARPAVEGDNSAAYFIIANKSLNSDTLLNASADVARAVEIHETMVTNEGMGANEQMQMVPQDSVKIAALRKTEFKPGGLHVMLIDIQQDLNIGDTFPLTLNFEKAGEITINVPVQSP